MKSIFIVGGVSLNSVITLKEFPDSKPQTIHNCDYNETIGNTGSGKALALSKLDFDTYLHAPIGKDSYGKIIIEHLNQSNLTFTYDIDLKGTERHLNILNSKGERISIFTNPSSDDPPINYELFRDRIAISDYTVINISNYCRNFIPICKEFNKEIWTDLHDYDGKNSYHQDFIDAADFIFFSDINYKNYRAFMKKMINLGKKIVVCSHGSNGATAYTHNKEWVYEPAILDFELVNSNGAGDNFFSGFLYAYSKGKAIDECMKFGAIAGALCVNSNELVSENLNKNVLETIYLEYYTS